MLRSQRGKFLAVLSLAAVLTCGFGVARSLQASEGGVDPRIIGELESLLSVTELSLHPVIVPEEPKDQENIVVTLDGVDHVIALERHSLRSRDFMAAINGEEEIEAPEVRTYLGTVEGVPGSTVAASLLPGGEFRGIIEMDEDNQWGVQIVPAEYGLAYDQHAVFRLGDILPPEWTCGVVDTDPEDGFDIGNGDTIQRGTGTADSICELACDADFPFYQQNGSSAANTIFDIEFVLNGVANIYRRDVGITYEITFINVWTTSADPYTTNQPGTLLNQFGFYWGNNFGAVPRDVAHLFTGTTLAGTTIGIASLSVICTSSAYGLSQSRYTSNINLRRSLTAHELGHNWSSQHCSGSDCRIMCPSNGGCTGDVTQFGQASKNFINGHENSRNCLASQPDAVLPPFSDVLNNLASSNWSWFRGAGVTSQGSNEPSPTTSLNLDAIGSGLFQQDIARTNWIDMTGTNAVASYWVEMRGLEPGESLKVRYWNNVGHWVDLNTVVSDGTTEDFYQFYVHQMPSAARHDNFRLEFSTTANTFSDDIFVDNVNVADAKILPGLILDSVITNPGGQITFTASVQNLTGSSLTGQQAWIDVFAPDNSPLFGSGNPKFGPKTFNLNASQTKTKNNIPINVPGSASLGTHRVVVYVGTFPDQVDNAIIGTFVVQ